MTYKQYRTIKIVLAMLISATVSQAVIINNFLYAAIAVSLSAAGLIYLKGRVTEVMADERDYQLSGEAARYASSFLAVSGSVLSLIFMSMRDQNPAYELVGSVIAYTVCAYLLVYSAIFSFLRRLPEGRKKGWFFVATLLAFIVLAIAGLRLFSGEDSWICQDGRWVEHGHPDGPAPTEPCNQ